MDDWPPWIEKPQNTHSGRLLALARCVYERHYSTEIHATHGPMRTFDTMCNGDLSRTAAVLVQAGFARYIDDIGRRCVFVFEPDAFDEKAHGQEASRVSEDDVCEALRLLATGYYSSSEEVEYLAKMNS